MHPSAPHSPAQPHRSQQHGLLPVHAQQPEATQLLRPLGVCVHQQQPPSWQPWHGLLQQLASRRQVACVFYTLLAAALLWYVAAGWANPAAGQPQLNTIPGSDSGNGQTPQQQQQQQRAAVANTTPHSVADGGSSSSTSSNTDSSGRTQQHARCPYGALPGTWVSSAPQGARWQVLDPNCQLKNLLAKYAAAAGAAAAHAPAANSAAATADAGNSSNSEALPAVNILLLSDSVDRYVLQHVCEHLHGTKHTVRAHQQHMAPTATPDPAAAQQEAAAAAAAGERSEAAAAPVQQAVDADTSSSDTAAGSGSHADTSSPQQAAAGAAAVGSGSSESQPASEQAQAAGPDNLNATAYAFHTCELPGSVPLKLASSYFPGVHPTGPFHRGLTQNYAARIQAAVAMWQEYAGAGQPPHVVGVASALWDVARLWKHERQQLEGQELSRPLLDSWVANFSSVVQYAKTQLPQAQLWFTHTTMLPAHDITTGTMKKPYLGRRYFIEQLNGAAATAARQLDLQLIDYAAVASRFREGQQHLTDLIHPNAKLSLEVFNVLLNLIMEHRSSD